jgi:DNA-binding MarR family transcriptional regulator
MVVMERDPQFGWAEFAGQYGHFMRSIERAGVSPGLPQAEARVAIELAHRPQTSAELTRSLAMDRGQVSRTIKSLEAKGFLERMSPDRSQAARLELTDDGREQAYEVMGRQNEAAAARLRKLPQADRDRLFHSLSNLHGHWLDSLKDFEVTYRDARPGELGLLVSGMVRSNELAARQAQMGEGFEGHVLRVFARYAAHQTPARNVLRLVERCGIILGSIMLFAESDPKVGRIDCHWINMHYIGNGFGSQLLKDCEARARELGYHRLIVTVPASVCGGPVIYQRHGWKQTGSDTRRAFGRMVTFETWELDISRP